LKQLGRFSPKSPDNLIFAGGLFSSSAQRYIFTAICRVALIHKRFALPRFALAHSFSVAIAQRTAL